MVGTLTTTTEINIRLAPQFSIISHKTIRGDLIKIIFKGKAIFSGLFRPRWFQKVEDPGLQDNRNTKVEKDIFLLEAELTPGPYYINEKFH